MGRYRIEIVGHGIHHNGRADDADHIGRNVVNTLRGGGHDVESATLTMLEGREEQIAESTDLTKPPAAVAQSDQ